MFATGVQVGGVPHLAQAAAAVGGRPIPCLKVLTVEIECISRLSAKTNSGNQVNINKVNTIVSNIFTPLTYFQLDYVC